MADAQGGHSSSEAPTEVVVAQPASQPLPSPAPINVEVVTLNRGDLWKRALSFELRAVIAPPADLSVSSPLPREVLTAFRRLQEDALKAASLINTNKDLHRKYEKSSSSNTTLSVKVAKLSKKNLDLFAEKSSLATEVDCLSGDLIKTREVLVRSTSEAKAAVATMRSKEDQLKLVEADNAKLRANYEEAQENLGRVAEEVFENALAQVRALNPGLDTRGVDLGSYVEDGLSCLTFRLAKRQGWLRRPRPPP